MIYILVFDIICFSNYENPQLELAQIMIPIALIYVTIAYTIEAIYHWYRPIPMLIDAAKEENEKPQEDVIDTTVEEVKEENKED